MHKLRTEFPVAERFLSILHRIAHLRARFCAQWLMSNPSCEENS